MTLKIDKTTFERDEEYRQPYYVADWKRSIPYVHDSIATDDLDEPHIKRKHVILKKYPSIQQLFGPEHSTKYILFVLVSIQLSIAYYFGHSENNALIYCLTVYFVGASLTQIFGTCIHEATHNLTATSPMVNKFVLAFDCRLAFLQTFAFRSPSTHPSDVIIWNIMHIKEW
jgi:sphingolipid 4-desaturase/C4-monooxygenase